MRASSIMYASVAQLDRSFGSDNCDAVAQAITFERYSVRKTDAAPFFPVV